MVDNRGVSPISSFNFKSGDASGMANKMSEEKYGQGGEYFQQEMQEEEDQNQQDNYQDRSAQLRASLDSLAVANEGSMMVIKMLKEKERLQKEKAKTKESPKYKRIEDKNDKEAEEENL